MKIKFHLYNSNKFHLFMITVILLLAHKCFYLWLQDDYIINGLFKYSDIPIVLSIVYTLAVVLFYGLPKDRIFSKYVYLFYLLAIISAVTAWVFFGQSILRGITVQRGQIAYFTLFLGVSCLLEKKVVNRHDIIRWIYILAWAELILCTYQYFLYNITGSLFLNVNTNIRYDESRFYFDPAILLMVVFMSFENFLKTKKHRIANCVFVAWVLFFLMVITKMRAMTLEFLLTLIAGFFVWKGSALKKLKYFILGVVLAVSGLSRFDIIKDLTNALLNLDEDANYGVRLSGRSVFMREFSKSPLTGRGYPSVESENAFGVLQSYLFVDNGIFGIIYSYGILGIVWWLCMWINLMLKAWKIRRRTLCYLMYLFYYLIGIITDFSWFWTATASFSVIIALMLDEYRDAATGNEASSVR